MALSEKEIDINFELYDIVKRAHHNGISYNSLEAMLFVAYDSAVAEANVEAQKARLGLRNWKASINREIRKIEKLRDTGRNIVCRR